MLCRLFSGEIPFLEGENWLQGVLFLVVTKNLTILKVPCLPYQGPDTIVRRNGPSLICIGAVSFQDQ